jgi:hypothetical protein
MAGRPRTLRGHPQASPGSGPCGGAHGGRACRHRRRLQRTRASQLMSEPAAWRITVTWPKPPPSVGQAARLFPLGGEHRLAGPVHPAPTPRPRQPLLAASLYEDPSAGLHEDASARLREHPVLLCCSILRVPSPRPVWAATRIALAATRDGIVVVTESDRIRGTALRVSCRSLKYLFIRRVTVTAHARSDLPVMVLAVFKTGI